MLSASPVLFAPLCFTGKYLNAMREGQGTGTSTQKGASSRSTAGGYPSASSAVSPSGPPRAPITFDLQGGYLPLIDAAHARASRSLLDLLTQGQSLLLWLRAIKHYFLMDRVRQELGD